jgi:CRP-like cAMP-binding protein
MSIEATTNRAPSAEHFHAGPRVVAGTTASSRKRLSDCAVFSDLETSDLEHLMARADTRRFEAGETIFRSGDDGDSVLFIRSGSVVVEAERSNHALVPLNAIPSGEIFGEIAVIEGTTRSATVTAYEDCELIVIPQAEFLALLVKHPGMGIRVLGAVARRLRHLTDIVGDTTTLDVRSAPSVA